MFQLTTAYKKISALTKRIRFIPGGSSASKTISVLLYLIAYAQTDETPTLTSVISESIPHLKRGTIRDFKNILQAHGYWKDDSWNGTDRTYTFETGSQIEFFSADNSNKLRGGRRDRAFFNEANNITFDAFEQVEMRTKEFVIADWNPSSSFWAYENLNDRTDVEWLTLTYLDNEAIDPRIRASIESRRNRTEWWKVYGLGQLGEVAARIYTSWTTIDDVPTDAKLIARGLDFGYTNDPTAIVDIYKYNNGFIFDEKCYQRGMSNKNIADLLKELPNNIITYGDSSEPKSIAEIKSYGINILGADKGPGSINQGIQFIKDQTIYVTKNSTNLLKEYRGYLWMTDNSGKIINVPCDVDDHLLDAARYGFSNIRQAVMPVKRLIQQYTPTTQYGG